MSVPGMGSPQNTGSLFRSRSPSCMPVVKVLDVCDSVMPYPASRRMPAPAVSSSHRRRISIDKRWENDMHRRCCNDVRLRASALAASSSSR